LNLIVFFAKRVGDPEAIKFLGFGILGSQRIFWKVYINGLSICERLAICLEALRTLGGDRKTLIVEIGMREQEIT
jgi:hypothetical protein